MRRTILAAVIVMLALTGCGRDVRTASLTAYDLANRDVVNGILGELSPQERGPFLTYTIHHLATSKAFCGDVLVNKNGREPATIGEAIRLTIAREEELSRTPEVIDPATLNPVVRYRLKLGELESERGLLIDDREALLMTQEDALDGAEYKELQVQIVALTEEIAAFRQTAPAGAEAP